MRLTSYPWQTILEAKWLLIGYVSIFQYGLLSWNLASCLLFHSLIHKKFKKQKNRGIETVFFNRKHWKRLSQKMNTVVTQKKDFVK